MKARLCDVCGKVVNTRVNYVHKIRKVDLDPKWLDRRPPAPIEMCEECFNDFKLYIANKMSGKGIKHEGRIG